MGGRSVANVWAEGEKNTLVQRVQYRLIIRRIQMVKPGARSRWVRRCKFGVFQKCIVVECQSFWSLLRQFVCCVMDTSP